MLAPSMMGSRISLGSTLACGTAPCRSRRSSALPFVTTPDNRLRYKRGNSRLCTKGWYRHLVRPRRLRKAVLQGSARRTDDSDAPDCMTDGLKFERKQRGDPVIQTPSPVPGGFENRPSMMNDTTPSAQQNRRHWGIGIRVGIPPGLWTIRVQLGDTSRNGNSCTFEENRSNVFNSLSGHWQLILVYKRAAHSLLVSCGLRKAYL
jgi:hypothetical protein